MKKIDFYQYDVVIQTTRAKASLDAMLSKSEEEKVKARQFLVEKEREIRNMAFRGLEAALKKDYGPDAWFVYDGNAIAYSTK